MEKIWIPLQVARGYDTVHSRTCLNEHGEDAEKKKRIINYIQPPPCPVAEEVAPKLKGERGGGMWFDALKATTSLSEI